MAPNAIITKSAIREVTDEFTRTNRSTKWGKWFTSEFGVTVSKARLDELFAAMGAKGAAKTKADFLDKAVPLVAELLRSNGVTVMEDVSDDDESFGSVSDSPAKKVVVARAASPEMGSVLTNGDSTLSAKSGIMSKSGKTELSLVQLARGAAMKKAYADLKEDDPMVEEADGTKVRWSTLKNGRKLGVVSKLVSENSEIKELSGQAAKDAKKKKEADIAEILMANGIDMSKLKISVRSVSLKA